MSRKRRMFEVEMPADLGSNQSAPVGSGHGTAVRRGPMAAAISETVDSRRDRADAEARIRAENDALAAEFVRLKKAGLITDRIPLDAVDATKLVRDRAPEREEDLAELVASIRDVGLSNPIRVEQAGQGRYELIQGFRRLAAYRRLLDETGDTAAWGTIPAGIVAAGETLEGLYRRMVDENLVRKDISFAEMARLALDYARDPNTLQDDPDKAVAELFQSAGYQKRSYVRTFIKLVDAFDGVLAHPQAISRSLGLDLAARLEADPDLPQRVAADLPRGEDRDAAAELAVLRRHLAAPAKKPGTAGSGSLTAKAKTTFQLTHRSGRAKCTAANGRLELRLPIDFSALDRHRLEQAVARMLDALDAGDG